MSKKKTEKTSSTVGATDLLERLRQVQANQAQSTQNEVSQAVPLHAENDLKVEVPEPSILSQEELTPENPSNFESGKMPPDAKRALVSLLKHGVILAAQKNNLFESVCRYQSAIKNHLSEVYLKLVLDEKSGVVFVAQMDESEHEDQDAVSLMTRRTLSLYDTLLLLVLRKHYQERESAGEQRIMIDIERIEANLTPFLPLTNSMKSDQRKLSSALNRMKEKHLLSNVRGSEDRFEITPIIRYIVNADFLEKMMEAYKSLAQKSDVELK